MSKSSVATYSLIELPPISKSSNPNNDDVPIRNIEPYPPEHGTSPRVHFLEPHSVNKTMSLRSRSPRSIPSFESMEASSLENINDLHQDGPNSVSRGLQTDISSSSVIDWVLAQKSSMTGERYIISDMMHKCT